MRENDVKDSFDKYSKEEFFRIFNFYRKANYSQKLAFMKSTWGNIVTETTFHYENKCSITIGFDDLGKYFFDFNCSEIDIAEMKQKLPEYTDALLNLDEEDLKNLYPEIVDIQVVGKDSMSLKENVLDDINDDVLGLSTGDDIKISSDFINIYNGINFNKGLKE